MTDHDMLARVRNLLAKAESTEFAAEAEALTAKAQELMATYAIDQALLESGTGRVRDRGEPTSRNITIDAPYATAKVTLLGTVAEANRCQCLSSSNGRRAEVFGFATDLDAVDALYTSLLLQAVRAVHQTGGVTDHAGRNRTKSFRRSFLIGYACRIGERLQEAAHAAESAATQTHGAGLLPVLADRAAQVDAAVARAHPRVERRRLSSSHSGGLQAGHHAANTADVGTTKLDSRRGIALSA